MTDQVGKVNRVPGQTAQSQLRRTRELRQRVVVVTCLWLILVVFSSQWVWTLIGTFFVMFLVFGIDDELQALEPDQHQHDSIEF